MKSNKLKMNKRTKNNLLRAIAFLLFAVMVVNTTVSIYAYTPQTYQYSMVNGELMLLDDDQAPLGDPIVITDVETEEEEQESEEEEQEPEEEEQKTEEPVTEPVDNAIIAQMPDIVPEPAESPDPDATETPKNTDGLEMIQTGDGATPDVTMSASPTATATASATPTATASATPSATPAGKNISRLTVDENGDIYGINIEDLTVKVRYSDSEMLADDTFGLKIKSEDGELPDLSAGSVSVSGSGNSYTISGIGKDTSSFTISGLDKKEFSMYAFAESNNEAELSFSLDAQVGPEGSGPSATLIIKVTVEKETDEDDEEKIEGSLDEGDIKNSASSISSVHVSLMGDGIESGTEFVVKDASSEKEAFEEFIENSEYTLVENGLYVFDMQFEKDGKYVAADQDVRVSLNFDPALFEGNSDAEYYLVLHDGDNEPLAKISASEQGLSEIAFTSDSFSPFAVAAVSGEQEEDTDREAKIFDMEARGWVKGSSVSKKVGNSYIPITDPSITLDDDDELRLTIIYKISENVTFVAGDTMTYVIPEYLKLVSTSGEVMGNDNMLAGAYEINAETRVLKITLESEEYIKSTQGKFSGGMLTFEGKLDTTKLEPDETGEVMILYSVAKCLVGLEPEKQEVRDAFEIEKKHDVSKDESGVLAYVITVKAKDADPEETYTDVKVVDQFIQGNEIIEYDQDKFPDVDVEFNEDKQAFVWTIGEMKSGETREITYYTNYDQEEFDGATIKNEAVLTVKELPGELKASSTVIGDSKVNMSKTVVMQEFTTENGNTTGKYNWNDHTVIYQINVNAPASNAFAVNAVVVKDAFQGTDNSNEYVLDDYTFELKEGGTPDITNTNREGFDWNVGTLQPGESKTLVYTVKLVDYSAEGESAYSNNKYDIWYRGEDVNNPVYKLDNLAILCRDTDNVVSKKTATVNFNRTFVKKDTDHVKQNIEDKTVTFEILANGNASVPAFNISGWQFHDEVSAGWKYTGTLEVYAFDKFVNHAGSATPVLTYAFDAEACDEYFNFSNSADGSKSSEFTFTVPGTDEFKNKFLILKYDIGLVDDSKWGTIDYSNSVGYGGGNGWSITPPGSTINKGAAFGGGIEKEFVSRTGDLLNWESTVTADVTKESTVVDYVANSVYQTFEADSLNLVVKQGETTLTEGSDYSYKIDNKGRFTVTFLDDFEGPITLNYNSKINKGAFVSAADGYIALTNFSKLTVPYGTAPSGDPIYLKDEASAWFRYPHFSDISKAFRMNCLNTDGTIEWKIVVNKSGGMSSAVIQEVAPEGTVIDLDSIQIGYRASKAGDARIVSKELTDDGKGAIIKLDGLQETLDENAYVEVWVKTKVVDDDFWMGENSSSGREFVNKAILLNENGEPVKEVSANYMATYTPIAKTGTYNSETGELSYRIVVNQGSNDLLQNADTVTLVDDMDPSISVIPESIVVTGKNGEVIDTTGKINYKPAGVENGFAIIIPDDQKITITYKVQVNAAVGTKLSVSNSAYFYGRSAGTKPVEEKTEFYVQTCGVTVLSDQVLIRKTTSSGNPLEGAEFKIYTVESNGTRTLSQTVTTDKDGNAVINGLLAGKLYAYLETKAPAGYMFEGGDIHYFWVSESDSTKAPTIPSGISNVETYQFRATIYVINDKPGVAVIKTGEEGERLEGAEFTLYQGDAEIARVVTDNSGLAIFKDLEAGGSYRLEETKAPSHYVKGESSYLINIDQAGKITVDEQGGSQTYTIGDAVESNAISYPSIIIRNELKKGAIRLIKKDSEDGTLLEGAVFELYQITDAQGEGTGSRYPSDTTTYTTDENGEIVVTNLPVGTYYFKEIMAPEDYQLPENLESERVTLAKENLDEAADNPLTVEVTNKKLSGVVLQKVGSDGRELAGAEFELYKEDDTLIGSYVTGTNGVLHVAKRLAEGNYYFVETKAPEGYQITLGNNGEAVKYSFTVDAEHNSIVGIDLGRVENQRLPEPEPEPTPGDTPTPTPDDTPETTPGDTPAPTVPVGNGNEGQVLGASRVRASGLEAAVLGARRGTDFAVLGKRRRPSTGDSMALIIWMITLFAAAGVAATTGTMLYRKKKKEK